MKKSEIIYFDGERVYPSTNLISKSRSKLAEIRGERILALFATPESRLKKLQKLYQSKIIIDFDFLEFADKVDDNQRSILHEVISDDNLFLKLLKVSDMRQILMLKDAFGDFTYSNADNAKACIKMSTYFPNKEFKFTLAADTIEILWFPESKESHRITKSEENKQWIRLSQWMEEHLNQNSPEYSLGETFHALEGWVRITPLPVAKKVMDWVELNQPEYSSSLLLSLTETEFMHCQDPERFESINDTPASWLVAFS